MAIGHDKIETNIGLMIILIIITVSIGGLVQIVPLFFQQSTTEAVAGLAGAYHRVLSADGCRVDSRLCPLGPHVR